MILEIDAGNSRIKWRVIDHHQVSVIASNATNTQALAEAEAGFTMLDKVFSSLSSNPANTLTRARVSSVRGGGFDAMLSDWLREKWHLEAEFAGVERHCGGVTNSYADITTMGVDRWLVMLAAYKRAQGACCILDCGSAATYDWLDAEGFHQGGYIVPGLYLMQESLSRKTPALKISFEQWTSPVPGRSTQAAITSGLVAMLTGFADRCYLESKTREGEEAKEIPNRENNPQWFLTGGDAELLSKHLRWPHLVEKDLVLEGLAIALP
ncbi:type III pantothenate kinase [Gammaproteobacteria bacterium]|nr:type III pantothenate kinase [Gammaproteobacteria bacterium]